MSKYRPFGKFHSIMLELAEKNPIKSLCNSRDSPKLSFDHGADIGSAADSGNGASA
ncbi:hypothetical protein BN77_1027 [Rhizobium mesoamericanum STM3625]|uniref:Uncharacterized protein n=1 Tax=Rhizobium mesoamericanum STM3625 TaxID=1211777 RepID=K0PRV6_9HYPH|nr:hypothetical protein BN77_1027 [Rhizobium mesoamericanum STM3625]